MLLFMKEKGCNYVPIESNAYNNINIKVVL